VETTESRLRDEHGRPKFNLNFFLLAKDGTYAGVSMWGPVKFAVADDRGPRMEDAVYLYERMG